MTDTTGQPAPFKAALGAVAFVTAIFFCNFLSRIVLAPLMPEVQADLGFDHAGAGHLFLALALGNGAGLLLSGFVSRRMNHRRTVGISALLAGGVALLVPLAESYGTLFLALLALGVAVGLYLPSGIAAVTSLVRSEDWGKALATHELAPNAAYVVAPLLAEGVLLFFNWRVALYVMGAVQIVLGLWFLKSGRGGEYPGRVPGPRMVLTIIRRPIFWILVLFFSMSVGASVGPYSMLPLYLTDAHGYARREANELLAASRVAACFAPFLAGWITDRWGARPAILISLLVTGTSLIVLGLASGSLLMAMVVVQSVFSVFLFAPGFTLLSQVFSPAERSVVVALMGPFNAVVGIGLIPTFLGHMGQAGMFNIGFLIQGCLLLAAMTFLSFIPKGAGGRS